MSQLHVTETGSGDRTAVLVHGLSASSAGWGQLTARLVDLGYRVISPDLRGHGKSPRGEYSRERWTDELLEVLPGKPDLAIGHSLGGVLLAMAVERLRPERAVYVDPAWYPWDGHGFGEAQPHIRALKDSTVEVIRASSPLWTEETVAARFTELEDWDPETTRMAYLETAYLPVFPVVPSLVVLAELTTMIAPPLADHLTATGFELRSVPNTGHFVHLDDFEGFMAALKGWV